MAVAFRICACSAALAATGCFPPGDGLEPSLSDLYYPVGVEIDDRASRLYVANSNFDLQYNAGTLQAYDLEAIRRLANEYGRPSSSDQSAEEYCGELGVKGNADTLLAPGRCGPVDPQAPPGGGSLLVDAVEIGGFVTDVVFRKKPGGGAGRLFMPVRGDATLHWVDVEPGVSDRELDCGSGKECDDRHRVGDSPAIENSRNERLPAEPFGIAVDEHAGAVVLTHQVTGEVSLFTNDWERGPRLEDVQGGLPIGAIAAAPVPAPVLSHFPPSFLVTFRNAAQIRLLRYFDDAEANPERPFLDASAWVPITAIAQGFEARGIAVDDASRDRCEAACPQGENCSDRCAVAHPEDSRARAACETDCRCTKPCGGPGECESQCVQCYEKCETEPVDVYVSNRLPNTLMVGQTQVDPPSDLPTMNDVYPLTQGASRVILGNVLSPDNELLPRVFVVCFDSRTIHIYNPGNRDPERIVNTGSAPHIEKVVETGRGPHAFVVDTRAVEGEPDQSHAFGYVGHFTDSYVGVLDLDQGSPTYGQMLLTLGLPTPPKESE